MTHIPVTTVGLVLFPLDIAKANLLKFRRTKNPLACSDTDFQTAFDAGTLSWQYSDIEVLTDACDRIEALENFNGRIETFDTKLANNPPICEDKTGIVYLPLHKKPDYFKASYADTAEMLKEVKDTLGLVLPPEFDYGQHLCEITGVTSI